MPGGTRSTRSVFFGDYREGSTTQVRFPRDADGKYNPKGEYREKALLLNVKYNKQGRFCLGVDTLSLMTAGDCIDWMRKTLVPGIRTRRTIYS